jgi:hypothetical protein
MYTHILLSSYKSLHAEPSFREKEKGLGVLSLLIIQLLGEVLSSGQTTNRIIHTKIREKENNVCLTLNK